MANKLNILVVGANGQLGRGIRNLSVTMSDNYYYADVTQIPGEETLFLDATDKESVSRIVRDLDINVIINCAAYTDVEKAEDDQNMCALLNVEVPSLLASIMKETFWCIYPLIMCLMANDMVLLILKRNRSHR